MKADHVIDCSWHLCPVPILMTQEKIASLPKDSVLEVIYTDPGARPDLEAWCKASGHAIVGFEETRKKSSAFIRKQ